MMIFQQEQYINPREIYQSSSQNYGAGVGQQGQMSQQNFNNIQPRTRSERQLEGYGNYEYNNGRNIMNSRFQNTPTQNQLKDLLHNPGENTTLFQPDNQRFNQDYATEDKINREYQRQQKEMKYEARRIQHFEREGFSWKRNEDQLQKEENKRRMQNEQYREGKRNGNGLPYNPLTLEYADTEQGQLLRQRDENQHVRNLVRAQNLDTRANCGYNPLTVKGESRGGLESIVPAQLKSTYDQKVKEKEDYYNIKHYALQQQLMQNSKY